MNPHFPFKGEFQVKDIEQDLNRLLSDDLKVAAMPEFEMKIAMSCVGALITYLDL